MLNSLVENLRPILILSLFLIFLVSCGPADGPDVDFVESVNTNNDLNADSYPLSSTTALPQISYPGDGETDIQGSNNKTESYPPPIKTEEPVVDPRFRIDSPVSAEDMAVSGQALPNLSLAVVDITYNGIVLGTGLSNERGQFSISVTGLPAGHRIGITIADLLPGQTFSETVLELHPHRGTGFMNIPNVGVFFDTILVEP